MEKLVSLHVAIGNPRVRVAGAGRTYIATAFRLTTLRLPLHKVKVLGMPGSVVSIAKALPDWPDVDLGEPSTEDRADPATEMHADEVRDAETIMAKGSSKSAPSNGPSTTGNKSGGGRGNNPPKGK